MPVSACSEAWCNLDFMTAMAGSRSVTRRRWPRKVSNCTTRPRGRAGWPGQTRPARETKSQPVLCRRAETGELYLSTGESCLEHCMSVQTATARTFVSKKRWRTSANWLLGKKHLKFLVQPQSCTSLNCKYKSTPKKVTIWYYYELNKLFKYSAPAQRG